MVRKMHKKLKEELVKLKGFCGLNITKQHNYKIYTKKKKFKNLKIEERMWYS